MPFNATLIFGITLAGIFDFLSPRVALLPVAATLAVAGLITALLLRKFVAPSLPSGSALHRALAPNVSLHKSPLLISASTLSALLVSGAAWSNASSAAGGIIAGKFDAARNAQMQLGVMQGLQKEQRVQTAVLEDIREGRTTNPRRELANQGILWDGEGFNSAIRNADMPVVQLFLSGGKRWKLSDTESAINRKDQEMTALLLQYPTLLDRYEEKDCSNIAWTLKDAKLEYFRETHLKYESQPAPSLTTTEKRFLKLFCTSTKHFSYLNDRLKSHSETYQEQLRKRDAITNSVGLSPAPGTRRTSTECKRDLLANNAKSTIERARTFVPHGRNCSYLGGNPAPCYPFSEVHDALLEAVKKKNLRGDGVLVAQIVHDVEKYCNEDFGQKAPFDDFDLQILKQIIDAVNLKDLLKPNL